MADGWKPHFYYGWVIVAAAAAILSLQWGINGTYALFLTEMCSDLEWGRAAVSGAYSLFAVTSCLLSMLAGRLNDRYGPRPVLMAAVIIMGMGYALMFTVTQLWQLYLFYGVVIAAGIGLGWVPAISTVTRWFVKRRGMALGITQAGMGPGSFVIVPLTQFLILRLGWRNAYLALAGLLVSLGPLAASAMKFSPVEKGCHPDDEETRSDSKSGGELVEAESHFTLRQALGTLQFWLLFVMYGSYGMRVGLSIHLKAYMASFGIPDMTAATAIGVGSISHTVGVLAVSKLSDRTGRKPLLFVCFLVLTVLTAWLLRTKQAWEFYLYFVAAGFSGAGFALFPAILADYFGTKFHGSIYGVLDVSWGIGGAISPVLAGYLYDVTGSYELAFVTVAVVLGGATACAFVLKPPLKGDLNS